MAFFDVGGDRRTVLRTTRYRLEGDMVSTIFDDGEFFDVVIREATSFVSFYRPTTERYKILSEAKMFRRTVTSRRDGEAFLVQSFVRSAHPLIYTPSIAWAAAQGSEKYMLVRIVSARRSTQ